MACAGPAVQRVRGSRGLDRTRNPPPPTLSHARSQEYRLVPLKEALLARQLVDCVAKISMVKDVRECMAYPMRRDVCLFVGFAVEEEHEESKS